METDGRKIYGERFQFVRRASQDSKPQLNFVKSKFDCGCVSDLKSFVLVPKAGYST